jgi:hypothetical protein
VRRWCEGARGGRGGGRAVEVDAEDVEEWSLTGVWQGNDKVRV